jgi:hypothetical protein
MSSIINAVAFTNNQLTTNLVNALRFDPACGGTHGPEPVEG